MAVVAGLATMGSLLYFRRELQPGRTGGQALRSATPRFGPTATRRLGSSRDDDSDSEDGFAFASLDAAQKQRLITESSL
jgi:hypothetical protein